MKVAPVPAYSRQLTPGSRDVDSGLLLLHQCSESFERFVPLIGDLIEVQARLGKALRLELIDLRPPFARAPDKACICERVQVLGYRLA